MPDFWHFYSYFRHYILIDTCIKRATMDRTATESQPQNAARQHLEDIMAKERILLAYSGGLDTSVIIPWLKEHYDCSVIAMEIGRAHV